MKYTLDTIYVLKTILKDKFYWKVVVVAGLVLAYVNYWLFYRVTMLSTFFEMARDGELFGKYSIPYAILYVLLTILIIIAFGLSSAILVWQLKNSKASSGKNFFANSAGFLSSAFGSACPVCGAFLLQLVGVMSGVSLFPLGGLEFKILSLGLIAGATVFSAAKIKDSLNNHCVACEVESKNVEETKSEIATSIKSLQHGVVYFLIAAFILNQLVIGQAAAALGVHTGFGVKNVGKFFGSLIGIQSASAKSIISTKINPDKRTTTLATWPTITEVPAEPNTGDVVADARVVMLPSGTPFYAPEGISFDDAEGSLTAWGRYEDEILLDVELQARWEEITSTMTCDYCCGSPNSVTVINRCGCDHAKAFRSIAKYLLSNYGSEYSNEEIIGELHRWKGAWYPKGVIEDYLLATGRGDVLGHSTHGGAGGDGRHGF